MKLGLNFRLSQSIKLTPLLQQSIKFLNASQSELNDLIEDYLSDNVFLAAKDESLLSQKNYHTLIHQMKIIMMFSTPK